MPCSQNTRSVIFKNGQMIEGGMQVPHKLPQFPDRCQLTCQETIPRNAFNSKSIRCPWITNTTHPLGCSCRAWERKSTAPSPWFHWKAKNPSCQPGNVPSGQTIIIQPAKSWNMGSVSKWPFGICEWHKCRCPSKSKSFDGRSSKFPSRPSEDYLSHQSQMKTFS